VFHSESGTFGTPGTIWNSNNYDEVGEMVKNLFIKGGQILTKEQVAKIGNPDNLCFSEVTIFELCKKV
jgi:hypothetical protein